MDAPLLQVKLNIPPRRTNLVTRQHLVDQLNLGLERKLSLISAPAGFGKTTLISDWIEQVPPEVGISWLSLDEEDSETSRFFLYLIHALQSVHPPIGQDLLAGAALPPPNSIMQILANQAGGFDREWILVLDDYQMITLPEIHSSVEQFLDYLPPNMHLVLISRIDPPFSLSKLRVRRQLVEIRARDLRFKTLEIQQFLNQTMTLNLSLEEVALLDERTEGWIAALQLASHSLSLAENRKAFLTAFAGDDRYIADYLVEEVLAHLDEDVQTFLHRTSILNRFNSALCDAVLQREGSQEILEFLDQSNLFVIPLDNRRQWYRYHHLFGDLLCQRLADHPQEENELHRFAGAWFADHDRTLEAVEHFISAQDYDTAVQIILDGSIKIFISGQIPALTRLWSRLPPEKVLTNSPFCMMMAWAFLATGKPGEAEACLQAIERQLDSSMDRLVATIDTLTPEVRNALIEVAAVRMSFQTVARMDATAILNMCEKILPFLEEGDQVHLYNPTFSLRPVVMFNTGLALASLRRYERAAAALQKAVELGAALGNIHIVAPALGHLAETALVQGNLQQAAEVCREGLVQLDGLGGNQSPLAGMLHVKLGRLHYEWNEVEKAITQFEEGIELATRWQNREVLLAGFEGLLRALLSRGAAERAALVYDQFLARSLSSMPEEPLNDAYLALIHLHMGQTAPARKWMDRWLADQAPFANETEGVMMVRVLLRLARLEEAARLAVDLITTAEQSRASGRMVELLALRSQALAGLDDSRSAQEYLNRALDLGSRAGYLRIFLDTGPRVHEIIEAGVKNRTAPPYAAQVAAAIQSARNEGIPTTSAPRPAGLVEPLSEREIEVLQLIAEGLTNRQIAGRLHLTIGTVKAHAHNIYGKLGVSSRTQAVSKAQEIGYL